MAPFVSYSTSNIDHRWSLTSLNQLYKTNEGPRYIRGHAVSLAMVAMAAVIYAIMWLYFVSENRRRSAGKEDAKMVGKTEEEIAEMGDENPRFVFTY